MTISACMIVKNESNNIERCLNSIKDVVDEIIVVDTGSTDNTVELVKQHDKVKLYHHKWRNDFSEARNYSISKSTCDKILIIDADEEIDPISIPMFRGILERIVEDVVFFKLTNLMIHSQSRLYTPRIFTRGIAHYEGIVHNQLIWDKDKYRISYCDINLLHYGYSYDDTQMNKKYDRTQELLEKQLKEQDGDLFAWMNLIRVYRCRGEYFKVVETASNLLKREFDSKNGTLYHQIACDQAYSAIIVGQTLLNNERVYEGLRFLQEAYRVISMICVLFPRNLDSWFYRAQVAYAIGDYRSAISSCKMFIALRDQLEHEFFDSIIESWGSIDNIRRMLEVSTYKIRR